MIDEVRALRVENSELRNDVDRLNAANAKMSKRMLEAVDDTKRLKDLIYDMAMFPSLDYSQPILDRIRTALKETP